MENGRLSPDGQHEWDGNEWKQIPPPPRTKMDSHAYFQIFCVFLVVIVAIAILASLLS